MATLPGEAPASAAYALNDAELATAPPLRRRFWWIHKRMREAIALHKYPPGTRLDVSRTPVRAILQWREHEGLVITRHGIGTIVTEIHFERLRERQYYDELYHRNARMWFHFMPKLDWPSEIAIFQADIEARGRAMRRSDTRAVGFLIRNEISAVVIRLADLFVVAEKQSK